MTQYISTFGHQTDQLAILLRGLVVSLLAVLCTLLSPGLALAQSTTTALVPSDGTLATTVVDHETSQALRVARPPLPFRGPQIGPLIKRVPMNNIARRTTAFIPQSLASLNLTPVDEPEDERWIHVDLSEQLVVAYQNGQAIRAFVISSGMPGTPTVRGEFRIRTKVSEQTMSGGEGRNAYFLPGVKWVQYFFEEYSFHGTYWHSNFGHPMSHGCINMTDTDAKWLFDWAGPVWDGATTWYKSSPENLGTLVIVTE